MEVGVPSYRQQIAESAAQLLKKVGTTAAINNTYRIVSFTLH